MRWFKSSHGRSPDLVLKAHDPAGARRKTIGIVLLWVLSLLATWMIASYRAAPELLSLQAQSHANKSELSKLKAELDRAERKFSISEKSDQVSRTANESLQTTLRSQEEEIAGLRSDIAFFQRLMDGKSGRKGLTVQTLAVRAIANGRGYNLRATLTQNLRKGEVTKGTADISVDGMQNGAIVTLPWSEISGRKPATAVSFSFKYFQQLDSTLVLPEGFTPNRIKLAVTSEQGDKSETTFAWRQAISNGEADDVWQ